MADVVLETRNLTMRFGGVTAVDNVNFKLRRGELRCLIGPNGAGKTTFFRCLTGILKPTHGEVFIDDVETTGWDPQYVARMGIGIKTQVPSVMDGLSVRENIWLSAYRLSGAREADRIAAEVIERQPELAKYSAQNGGMPPALDNPLGARALYIFQNGEDTLYRLHGTQEVWSIGKAVSSGCVRLLNHDVIDLYDRVPNNTPIIVRDGVPARFAARPSLAPQAAGGSIVQPYANGATYETS